MESNNIRPIIKFVGLIVVAFFVLIYVSCSSKGKDDTLFDMNLNLSELLQTADSIAKEGDTDKALAIYKYISQKTRFLAPDDTVNAIAGFNASLTEAEIYFNKNSDYGNTLNALMQAQKIAYQHKFSQTAVDFMLGIVYLTVAEQNNVDSYFDKSGEYFVSVINNSSKADSSYSDYAVSNLIVYSDRGNIRSISSDALHRYFSSSASKHNDGYRFNMTLDSIMTSLHSHDYGMAMEIITRLSKSSRLPYHRVLPSIFFISGKISAEAGNYDKALAFYKKSEKHIDQKYGQDMELQVYEALEETYSRLGNEFMTGKYAEKANRLRRKMTSFSQISSFKQAELSEEMFTMESNLYQEKEKSQNLLRWSIVGLVFGISAVIIVGILLFFMKRLREKNEILYLRYVELLKLSHSPCSPISQPVKKATEKSEGGEQIIKEEESAVEVQSDKDSNEESETRKTEANKPDGSDIDSGRLFTEEVQRIEEVLSSSEELFCCDFSSATLSILTGIKPRLLSTIISERYHTTFRNLINSRRIRAVCRRLENGTEYNNLTVDAISESIGIRSRATFTSAFKRETGMTPAQYIRFAKSRK